jgi:hypothetical protein
MHPDLRRKLGAPRLQTGQRQEKPRRRMISATVLTVSSTTGDLRPARRSHWQWKQIEVSLRVNAPIESRSRVIWWICLGAMAILFLNAFRSLPLIADLLISGDGDDLTRLAGSARLAGGTVLVRHSPVPRPATRGYFNPLVALCRSRYRCLPGACVLGAAPDPSRTCRHHALANSPRVLCHSGDRPWGEPADGPGRGHRCACRLPDLEQAWRGVRGRPDRPSQHADPWRNGRSSTCRWCPDGGHSWALWRVSRRRSRWPSGLRCCPSWRSTGRDGPAPCLRRKGHRHLADRLQRRLYGRRVRCSWSDRRPSRPGVPTYCDVLAPPVLALAAVGIMATLASVVLGKTFPASSRTHPGGSGDRRGRALAGVTPAAALPCRTLRRSLARGASDHRDAGDRSAAGQHAALHDRPELLFRVLLPPVVIAVFALGAAVLMRGRIGKTIGIALIQSFVVFLASDLSSPLVQLRAANLMTPRSHVLAAFLGYAFVRIPRDNRLRAPAALLLLLAMPTVVEAASSLHRRAARLAGPGQHRRSGRRAGRDRSRRHIAATKPRWHEIASLPKSVIFSSLNLGPAIIVYTQHSVTSAGYHRNTAAFSNGVIALPKPQRPAGWPGQFRMPITWWSASAQARNGSSRGSRAQTGRIGWSK